MRKIVLFCSILLVIPLAASNAGGQEKARAQLATAQPVRYYHFDFVVEDLDSAGKVVNSRSYTTMVDTEPQFMTKIRTGSRVPIVTGTIAGNTQYQYIDLGVELDISYVHEIDRQLGFDLTANLSSVASVVSLSKPNDTHSEREPVIRQNKWASRVLVPIGKRTVVVTSDSLDSKGSTRVLVLATPIED